MGVGPLKTQEARNITREVFQEAYAVSVRDKSSADLLREIGITRDFPVAADPAWMVETAPSHGLPIEQRFPELAGKKVLAMILREWYLVQGWEERLAEALRAAVPTTWCCLWLPFQDVSDHLDRASFERIIAKAGCGTHAVWQGLSFEDVPGALSQADAAFAMRLHGVILAGQAGLPTAVFQYDDKVTSAADMVGIDEEWRVRFDDPPEKIAQVLRSVLAAADVSGALRPLKTADLGRDALQHKRFILETLSALAEIPRKKRGWSIAKFDWLLAWQREREGRASQFEGLTRNLLNREEQVQILSRDLADRKQELQGVEAQLVDRNRQVAELSQDLTERVRQIADLSEKALGLEKQRDELNNTLNEIWASRSWQVVKILRRIRQWMIPRGSRRAAFLRTMRRGVQVGRQGGMGALSRKFWGWALKGRIMNWYAFAFDSYKRARLSVHAADLRSLRVPSEPGLVSVVLPAFNGAHLLREALDSILVQTYPKFEVIAINDGSTDETGAILDEYARRDSRIHVIHQENRKIPRTLSRGFRAARGEFLTWTSVDNRLAPGFHRADGLLPATPPGLGYGVRQLGHHRRRRKTVDGIAVVQPLPAPAWKRTYLPAGRSLGIEYLAEQLCGGGFPVPGPGGLADRGLQLPSLHDRGLRLLDEGERPAEASACGLLEAGIRIPLSPAVLDPPG